MKQLLSLALVVSGSRAAYVPGAVCIGVDTFTTPASQMLIGRHLRVLDFEWPGFAMKKASAPHGWVGLDFDLLDLLQARLNFTYEVHEMISLEGETWEDMALRLAPQADLVLSYWSRTPRHLESLAFLAPHVDYAPVLVVKKDIVKEPSFWERFFQFARPFHPTIWAILMSMLCVSGGVDYLLEREQGGSLGASVYEYFAGTLWGGFQEPRSRLSAVYQIMLAFVLLITISAYTANLAAFMTTKQIPTLGASSIADLVAQRGLACTRTGDPMQNTYESVLPRDLLYRRVAYSDIGTELLSGRCMGVITPRINFDVWQTDTAMCPSALVGGSLFFGGAGWISNRAAAPCVQPAIERTLSLLSDEGALQALQAKWLAPAACGSTASGERRRRRRRLAADAAEVAEAAGGGTEDESNPPAAVWPSGQRRRLKGAKGAADAAAGGIEGQMQLADFTGTICLWAFATVSMIVVRMAEKMWMHRAARKAAQKALSIAGEKEQAAKALQARFRGNAVRARRGMLAVDARVDAALDSMFGENPESPNPRGFNSDAAAIRHLVKELHSMKRLMVAMMPSEMRVKPVARRDRENSPSAKDQPQTNLFA